MREALGYVRPYRGQLALVVVLSLISTGLSLAQPFLSKVLVDRALIGRDMGVLIWTVGGFLALTGVSLLLNVARGLRYTRVSANILFDMRLEVSETALTQLATAGFDPVYGARPLKRAIQQAIENPLAREILEGRFAAGDAIQVDHGKGGFVFGKAAAKGKKAA